MASDVGIALLAVSANSSFLALDIRTIIVSTMDSCYKQNRSGVVGCFCQLLRAL